jgi:uncharacterized membrane protein
MSSTEKTIEVAVPVRTAYNPWPQCATFPRFMVGVKGVRQLDDKRLEWRAELMGKDVRWSSEIVQQIPDQRITWKTTSGTWNAGSVSFLPVNAQRTKVTLRMEYEPEGVAENTASALGLVSKRIEGDLERFKAFIEDRGAATGAWRGEIHGQSVSR